MTHDDLTELQIEISELERENQELRDRVKELEVNLTYIAYGTTPQKETVQSSKPKLSVVS